MNEGKSRGKRRFFGGTGFYIALFLCMAALAVAGYLTILPENKTEETAPPAETVPQVREPTPISVPPEIPDEPPAEPPEETLPAQKTEEVAISAPPAVTKPLKPSEPTLIVSPLNGEILAAFSMEELRYSATMDDWRTHDGMDIAANVGTHVLASCSGTVASVENDDLMGTCVRINHDGGYQTVYAGLQSVPTVKAGDYVSAGQVIGSVGSTSIGECSEKPHLHFGVIREGEAIDPQAFLDRGK